MQRQNLNWDDLRVFLEVSRTQLLSKAASRLNLDQTTVSRRLQRLEDKLSVQLFERSRRGHKLTQAGCALRPYAEKVESATFSAQESLTGTDQALSGMIRVNVADGFGAHFVAPRLAEFTSLHPAIEVELVSNLNFLNVSQRETDIAVHLARPSADNLIVQKLTDYHLKLYASKDYLAKSEPINGPNDLSGHTFVGYIDDFIYASELRYMEDTVLNEPSRVRLSSTVAQYHAVRNGAGLCILPCFMAHGDSALVPLLEEVVLVTRTFWLIMPKDLKNVARVQSFAGFLTRICQREKSLLLGT